MDFYDFIPVNNSPCCMTANAEYLKIKEDFRFAKKLVTIEKLSLQKFKRDLEKGMWNEDKISQVFTEYFNIAPATDAVTLYHIGYEGLSLEAYYFASFCKIILFVYVMFAKILTARNMGFRRRN